MHGITHLSVIPVRKDPTDQSEMVTQLLFGDAFKVIEQKEIGIELLTHSITTRVGLTASNTFLFQKQLLIYFSNILLLFRQNYFK